MKSTFMKNALAALCLLASAPVFAQTYTDGSTTVTVSDVALHDSTSCISSFMVNHSIVVTGSFAGDVVDIVDSFAASLVATYTNTTGANPWYISAMPFYTNTNDFDVPVGGGPIFFNSYPYKVIHATDTVHCPAIYASLNVPNPCVYNTVTGKIYADMNADCIYNSGDVPLNPVVLSANEWYSPSFIGPGIPYVYIDPYFAPDYTAKFQQSWMDSVSVFIPPYYSFIFPYSSCLTATHTFTSLPQVNADFALTATAHVDVQCAAGSSSNARVAMPFMVHPYVSNIGVDTVSGTLTLIKDPRVIYNAALSINPATTVSGDTLFWNYSALTCIAGGAYWNSFSSGVHLTPNSTVAIGDTLCFRTYTGVPATDVNPANNSYSFCLPVVNSYDPNIKEVAPAGDGPQGYIPASTPELTYTIHFQNTGTAPAFVVKVVDTLDGDVDAASLRILGNSHSMTPEWLAPGVVSFNFYGINLADSFSNEPASHGFIRFSVKPHAGLAIGTQIKNKAQIYFDSNPAVITNTALNTIAIPTSVGTTQSTTAASIYPNPATNDLHVDNMTGGKVTILNMNGSVVAERNITNDKTSIDISKLPAGMYILKATNQNNTTTTKFVKQ